MLKKSRIAVIGAGNLGGALIGGLLEAGLPVARLRAADASAARRRELKKTYGIDATASNVDAVSGADAIVLAVKPPVVGPAVRELAGVLTKKQLIISLAAAVPISLIEDTLDQPQPVIRAMPNLAMTVGCSATALCQNSAATRGHCTLAQQTLPEVRLTSKLIDGKFPDYQRVVPKEESTDKSVIVDRELLRQSLARAAILSNDKYRAVRLCLEPNALRVVAKNPEQEEAEDEVEVSYEGESLEIGFNVSYLIDALTALPGDEAVIHLGDSNSSALITPREEGDCQYVVMPMRL